MTSCQSPRLTCSNSSEYKSYQLSSCSRNYHIGVKLSKSQYILPVFSQLLWIDLNLVSNFRLSIHPQKVFSNLNEIWYLGRGQWVLHHGMPFDPIERQGHGGLKVTKVTDFKVCLLRRYACNHSKDNSKLLILPRQYLNFDRTDCWYLSSFSQRKAWRDLQTYGVPRPANECCLFQGVDWQFHLRLIFCYKLPVVLSLLLCSEWLTAKTRKWSFIHLLSARYRCDLRITLNW